MEDTESEQTFCNADACIHRTSPQPGFPGAPYLSCIHFFFFCRCNTKFPSLPFLWCLSFSDHTHLLGTSLVFFQEYKTRLSLLYSEPRGWACDPHGRGLQLRPHPPSRSLMPCSRDLEGFLQPARISATGPGMRSPGRVERPLPAHPVRGGWSRCRRRTEAAAHEHSGVPCSCGDRRWPWSAQSRAATGFRPFSLN